MAVTKTYRNLVSIEYGTYIEVDGKKTHIRFIGGRLHPVRRNGTIRTEDPKVISAMENDHRFGKEWVLDSVEGEPEIIAPIAAKVESKEPDPGLMPMEPVESPVETPATPNEPDGPVKVYEPINFQQAKIWLNKNRNVPFSKMKNKDEVIAAAKELKVEFVNVK